MIEKTIVLFERYAGVRFVLERSLSTIANYFQIYTSHWMDDIINKINENAIDLLITELSNAHPAGLIISKQAREISPEIKIIWITVEGCHEFQEQIDKIGNIKCIEKPLDIKRFKKHVLEILEMDID